MSQRTRHPIPAPPSPDFARIEAYAAARKREGKFWLAGLFGFAAFMGATIYMAHRHPEPALRLISRTPEGCAVYRLTDDGREIVVCPVGWKLAPNG